MATGSLAPVVRYLRKATTLAPSSEASDAELLSRFSLNREEAAFTALVRRHGPMVLAVCRRMVRDWHQAEDAFQATFLVLARKAGSLARPELLAHFLYGVAHRTAAKARAEAARRRAREQQAVRTEDVAPDNELLRQDLHAVVDEEVNRLPDRYRVPVVLCYLQGHTNAEAARRLGCSRGTIATLLARARARLRRRLIQRGVSLSAGIVLAGLTQAVRGNAVSFPLEHGTVKAATLLAAGQTQAAGTLAGQAVALAKGVSKGMLIEKLKIPAAILMMTALVGAGAGITAYRARAQETQIVASDTEPQVRPVVKTDRPRKHVTAPAEPRTDEKAEVRSENFMVTAPTEQIARRVSEAAERNRKELAQLWLRKELPTWTKPCPVRVTVTDQSTNSFSIFAFQDGEVTRCGMFLEGPLDRIFADLLPHEMTHTILAEGRGRPLPRWADEGAATLSESAASQARYERALAKLVDQGHLLPLRDLLPKLDYPKEIMAFYAQSVSLTDFLVSSGGRKKFLRFVAQGERDGWNKAASGYSYKTVEELERAWLEQARKRVADKRRDESAHEHLETKAVTPPRGALPVQFKGRLPNGPVPVQVLVKLSESGRLLVCRKITFVEPVTEEVTLKNGQKRQITSYQQRHSDQAEVYDLAAIRVCDTTGKAIEEKELRKRLQGETPALVSANGRPVDPLYLRLYKEDTLIFVLPPRSAPTMTIPPAIPPSVDVSDENVPPPGR